MSRIRGEGRSCKQATRGSRQLKRIVKNKNKKMGSTQQQQLLLLFLFFLLSAVAPQVVRAVKPIPNSNLGVEEGDNSIGIIQKDIIETVNKHPDAGWTAAHNPYFANYTIAQFKRILGVKPTPQSVLTDVPAKTYSRSLKLPKEFDARSKWSHCSTIGNILGSLWLLLGIWCRGVPPRSFLHSYEHGEACRPLRGRAAPRRPPHCRSQVSIYHISWERDYGFCCHIDEECAKELADVPGVLSVRPDTNFGSDNKDYKGNDGFKSSEGTGAADIKTKRLFVTGLSFYTSEKTLRAAFQPFGELVEGTSATSKHQREFCGLTVNRPGMLVHTVVEHPSSTLGSAKVGNSDCSKKEELVLPTDSKHDSAKFSEDSS